MSRENPFSGAGKFDSGDIELMDTLERRGREGEVKAEVESAAEVRRAQGLRNLRSLWFENPEEEW